MSRMNTRRVRITVGADQSMMRSEWQKMRHTILLPLHVVIPFLGSSLFLLYYRIKNRYGLTEISGFLQIMGTVFPFLIAIVCSRNVQLEEDNHFQTFLGAVKRSKALFAKCAVLHVLGLFAVFLTIGSFALGGEVLFGGTDFKFWGMTVFAMWLGSVPLYWIHLGLNLRFSKNISLGFGVVQMLLSALLLTGLGNGGDDYITKPFGIGELRARVAAHLRRETREKKHRMSAGAFQFELGAKKMFCREEEVLLTKSEYAICEYLALNCGQVFSKERIYEHVFGFDGESDVSAITEHVKNIRAKCQKTGENPIETVWGIGYRWKKG